MRAVVCEKTTLEVAEVPAPVPAKGQVVLNVVACGICGSDLHARKHSDEMADAAAAAGYAHVMRPEHRVVLGPRVLRRRSPTTARRPAAR